MPRVEVEDVSVCFHGFRALDGVTFHAADGEALAIIGPNGAGKTTLFNALTGMVPLAGGWVRLDGQDITGLPPYRRAQLGLVRTFQKRSYFPRLTVWENLLTGFHMAMAAPNLADLLAGRTARQRQPEVMAEAEGILTFLGLERWRDTPAEALPYGKQRLLGIGIALAACPRVLLLDEPAAGMNPQEEESLLQLLRDLKGRVRNIILVEHRMRLVMQFADRIVVLNAGRKLAEGPPAQIQSDPQVVAAYLGSGVAVHD